MSNIFHLTFFKRVFALILFVTRFRCVFFFWKIFGKPWWHAIVRKIRVLCCYRGAFSKVLVRDTFFLLALFSCKEKPKFCFVSRSNFSLLNTKEYFFISEKFWLSLGSYDETFSQKFIPKVSHDSVVQLCTHLKRLSSSEFFFILFFVLISTTILNCPCFSISAKFSQCVSSCTEYVMCSRKRHWKSEN